MKDMELNILERTVLVNVMNSQQYSSILELRKADRVLSILEEDLPIFEELEKLSEEEQEKLSKYSLEDADFDFMNQNFNKVDKWNGMSRKVVIPLADKLIEVSKQKKEKKQKKK